MTHVSKLLLGAAAIAFLGGCSTFNSMFSKSDSTSTTSSSQTASNDAPSPSPSAGTPPISSSSLLSPAAAPAADTSPSSTATAIALTEVQNPKQALAHATVKDSKGEAIGEVKSIKVAGNGKLTSIRVAVGKRTVALKLDTLTYVQAENTIMSQQSKAEIQKTR